MIDNVMHFKPPTMYSTSVATYGCGLALDAGVLCTYDIYEVTCTACRMSWTPIEHAIEVQFA